MHAVVDFADELPTNSPHAPHIIVTCNPFHRRRAVNWRREGFELSHGGWAAAWRREVMN